MKAPRPYRLLPTAVRQGPQIKPAGLSRPLATFRICPALSWYVSAGLSPSEVQHGLNGYLAALGRTWLTTWRADQQAEQARYLTGMITAPRRAGYIIAGP